VPGEVIDLAVDPKTPAHAFAVTDHGLLVTDDLARSWRPAGEATAVVWQANGPLYVADADGSIRASEKGESKRDIRGVLDSPAIELSVGPRGELWRSAKIGSCASRATAAERGSRAIAYARRTGSRRDPATLVSPLHYRPDVVAALPQPAGPAARFREELRRRAGADKRLAQNLRLAGTRRRRLPMRANNSCALLSRCPFGVQTHSNWTQFPHRGGWGVTHEPAEMQGVLPLGAHRATACPCRRSRFESHQPPADVSFAACRPELAGGSALHRTDSDIAAVAVGGYPRECPIFTAQSEPRVALKARWLDDVVRTRRAPLQSGC